LAIGAGAIVLGVALLLLQVFVFNRVNIMLSLGCVVAILGGIASPFFLKGWACARCGNGLGFDTVHLSPAAMPGLEQALRARDLGTLVGLLDASVPAAEGTDVSFEVCEHAGCGRSLLVSSPSAQDVLFLDQDATTLAPRLARLVVESD
jgi:hypothetical protein